MKTLFIVLVSLLSTSFSLADDTLICAASLSPEITVRQIIDLAKYEKRGLFSDGEVAVHITNLPQNLSHPMDSKVYPKPFFDNERALDLPSRVPDFVIEEEHMRLGIEQELLNGMSDIPLLRHIQKVKIDAEREERNLKIKSDYPQPLPAARAREVYAAVPAFLLNQDRSLRRNSLTNWELNRGFFHDAVRWVKVEYVTVDGLFSRGPNSTKLRFRLSELGVGPSAAGRPVLSILTPFETNYYDSTRPSIPLEMTQLIRNLNFFSDLGIGPKYLGAFDREAKRWELAIDLPVGSYQPNVTSETFKSLDKIHSALINSRAILPDNVSYLYDGRGRLQIVHISTESLQFFSEDAGKAQQEKRFDKELESLVVKHPKAAREYANICDAAVNCERVKNILREHQL